MSNERNNRRNIAAHHYGSFDIELLWDTIQNDIPSLREYCNETMRKLEQGSDKTKRHEYGTH